MSDATGREHDDMKLAIRLLTRAMVTGDPIDRARACKFIELNLGSIDEPEIRKELNL